jgi:hypothetical protein
MPSSEQMFGGNHSQPKSEGGRLAPSMFERIKGTLLGDEPTPEEMERQYEAALHDKHVLLKQVNVKVFDMSNPDEVEDYCKTYRELYAKVQKKTAVVRAVDKKFVSEPRPRWLIYLEWWDYALEVDGKEVTPEQWEQIKKADSPFNTVESNGSSDAQNSTAQNAAEGETDDGERSTN